MNKEEIKKLLELYEQGLSSSEEEATLIKNLGESKNKTHPWFNYLNKKRVKTPENMEDQIWKNIQDKEKNKSRIALRILSVAASVTLLFSILWISTDVFEPKMMSFEEKVMLLKEARAMISADEESTTSREILYEDELLIIYAEK